ncbi:hypothetical protein ACIQNG_02545 [Streptomyces sp. NPDC091377]|uniref:hypothetical protein n=1 Tax=Streptomyces sp. NPDC091377 TaxID=3365995 RepID=UPI003816DDB0
MNQASTNERADTAANTGTGPTPHAEPPSAEPPSAEPPSAGRCSEGAAARMRTGLRASADPGTEPKTPPIGGTRTPTSTAIGTALGDTAPFGCWDPRATGRHRRRRSRKILVMVGGFVLILGVLSFVRLTPEPDAAGRPGAAEAGAWPAAPTRSSDRSTHAAATLPAEADGGAGDSPATDSVPEGTTPGAPVPDAETPVPDPGTTRSRAATGVGGATRPPGAAPGTREPVDATTPPAPPPPPSPPASPTPGTTTAPPPPAQQEPEKDPGLCLPVIHLCVGIG